MDRRNFLKGAGALTVLVLGGMAWRARSQGVFSVGRGPAYEPWHHWRADSERSPLELVRAAILAANPHNTQPWLFRVSESRIDLLADMNRNLGAFDPYLREMHLGLGCAIENMVLTADANGYRVNVNLLDGTLGPSSNSSEPTLVARLDPTPGEPNSSSLYEAIPRRHTNRGPYDVTRSLAPDILAVMQGMVQGDSDIRIFLFSSPAERKAFGEMIVRATEDIVKDKTMIEASDAWFRYDWADVHKYRDGPTLDAAGLPPFMTVLAKMLPTTSAETNHNHWLTSTRNVQVATAPLFGLIAVRELYDRAQTLRAGRVWQRLHLWAETQGIAMQPLNQPVELADRERELQRDLRTTHALARFTGDPTWHPTFVFRAGYPKRRATASPRRPVEHVVIS